ncbi:helix-turn-helix domain-containing protein [Streptomyces sp. AN091965]|uniref:helix-turn-helix domain-containing protein n=1 Tax=Streptomyces sp. AN091965 TaxID=2927803 RepID=UPI001F607E95|nr:helix-turn-helix transcriptional regulator [Streptomyces sp. AN091965]MCI3935303.1 helix-turn-helix transcriptional regulator [Streptomyces sp. AN091965]
MARPGGHGGRSEPSGGDGLPGPRFAARHGLSLFAEPSAYAVPRHRHPVWKVVLPLSGGVRVDGGAGAGVLVPPQHAHTCATSAGFVAVFVDPWCVRADPSGPTWLDERAVARLLAAWREDASALGHELAGVAGEPTAVDPRVAHAVRASALAERLDGVAADVGLSPGRLRTLVRTEVGVPLAVMRRWQRLRTAVGALLTDGSAIADAALGAGFADQAHLTRTVRALAGRTPASLLRR